MPYSHNAKFVFVHIPKCAGTSIERALRSCCKLENVGKFGPEFIEEHSLGLSSRFHLSGKHLSASDIRKLIGAETFDSYYSFAFVRNPFSRLTSYYHYLKRNNFTEFEKAQIRLASNSESFEDFLKAALDDDDPTVELLFNQLLYLLDENDNVLVKTVYKFENLEHNFASACRAINLRPGLKSFVKDRLGLPRTQIPKTNVGDGRSREYQTAFDPGLRRAVEERCQADLEAFDYSFDDINRGNHHNISFNQSQLTDRISLKPATR